MNNPLPGAESPTPSRFTITWRDGNYYVSIPDYAGGEVVTGEAFATLRAENEKLREALTEIAESHDSPENDKIARAALTPNTKKE